MMENYDEIVKEALLRGATAAKIISTRDICVGEWVLLKCKYGCKEYGNHYTCPPFTPSPEETKRILAEFSYGLLLQFKLAEPHKNIDEYNQCKKRIWSTMAGLEKKLVLTQYFKAFGLSSGPCRFCSKCKVISKKGNRSNLWKLITVIAHPFLTIKKIIKYLKSPYKSLRKAINDIFPEYPHEERCAFPSIARPSMEAIGIDVFTTVKKAGFDIKTLKSWNDIPTYYCLLLIE